MAAPVTVDLVDGVRQTTLGSGVRVVTESMPDVRSVAAGCWIAVGSRDESDDVLGASHFLEHLLFKGTERRTAKQIAEAIDEVGGDLNAFTGKEYTCFYARTLDRDVEAAVDVLGDMITSATINAEDVDAERNVVLEEIHMHHDTPEELVHSVFDESLFAGHPLGREVLGSRESIHGMPRDAVHGYYRRHYVPENLVVAAAGNLDHGHIVDRVARALERLAPAGGPTVRRTPPAVNRTERVVLRSRPVEQCHVVLGGPGLRRADDRRFAAHVLNQALGGGMASRLFQEVRERRGLAYTTYSYQGMHLDSGSFAVYAGTSPVKVATLLDVLREQLDTVRREGLDDGELARAKSHLAGSMVLALEDTGSRMVRLGKSIATSTPLLSLDDILAAIESVTHDDVREVADLLLAGPYTLTIVGPLEEADAADFAAVPAPRPLPGAPGGPDASRSPRADRRPAIGWLSSPA
jgi:predicted Zn-dependent peptidase